jgi:hypothetical protein
MIKIDINVTTELELLKGIQKFQTAQDNGDLSKLDLLNLLIELETEVSKQPTNKFLSRLRAYIKDTADII